MTDFPASAADITKEWLEENLNKSGNTKLVVTNFTVSAGVGGGDNFMSNTLKVEVEATEDGQKKTINLMMKLVPEDPPRRNLALNNGMFDREILFYNRILPDLQAFIKEKKLQKLVNLKVPANVFSGRTDTAAIVAMRHLGDEGFTMEDRTSAAGLAGDAAFLAIDTIGRFHGLSYAWKFTSGKDFRKEYGPLDDPFSRPQTAMDEMRKQMFTGMMMRNYASCVPAFEKLEHYASFKEKLQKLYTKAQDYLKQFVTPEEPWATLTHGDLWTNNMLFKTNADGKINEMALVDWQIARYTSPMIDLAYFLYTSTVKEFRDNNFDAMLDQYHKAVVEVCTAAGYDIVLEQGYTVDEIKRQFHEKRTFGFIFSTILIPVLVSTKTKEMDPTKVKREDMLKIFEEQMASETGVIIKKRVCDMVQEMVRDKVFDTL